MGIVTVLSFLRGPGRSRVGLSHDAGEGIRVRPEPSDSATEIANVGFSHELFNRTTAAEDPGNQPPSIAELLRPQVAEPVSQAGDEQVSEQTGSVESALANASEVIPERYQARENGEGWSVHDGQTGDTAEIYGYRLAKMNQFRAESLVAVLNRGEARKRGRNG
jgi:hypothetical protein